MQEVENLRYRISDDGQVDCYDRIHASPTLARPDHTFGFGFVPYAPIWPNLEPGWPPKSKLSARAPACV